jgi:hypothetical protein
LTNALRRIVGKRVRARLLNRARQLRDRLSGCRLRIDASPEGIRRVPLALLAALDSQQPEPAGAAASPARTCVDACGALRADASGGQWVTAARGAGFVFPVEWRRPTDCGILLVHPAEPLCQTSRPSKAQSVLCLPKSLRKFRRWFAEFDSAAWDAQIEEDVSGGKLNSLLSEAQADFASGPRKEP